MSSTDALHAALAQAEAACETAYVALVASRRSGSSWHFDRAFRVAQADLDIARFALADAEAIDRDMRCEMEPQPAALTLAELRRRCGLDTLRVRGAVDRSGGGRS
jgi:hypothetical protein